MLNAIQALTAADVLPLGQLREEIVRAWTLEVEGNREIVLTGRQRSHYLERHPEMTRWEHLLPALVLDPGEVHRNHREDNIANFYRKVDEAHYLRATVVMQLAPGKLKHSIITFRLAMTKEVRGGRDRLVWRR